jgi:hypothetical protein
MNAFNSNCFDAAGAASFHSQEGARQLVDGTEITRRSARPQL